MHEPRRSRSLAPSEVALCLAIAVYLFVAVAVDVNLLAVPSLLALAAEVTIRVRELATEPRSAPHNRGSQTGHPSTGGSPHPVTVLADRIRSRRR